MNNGSDPTGKGQAGDPTVLACVVFQTREPEQLLQLLREALRGIAAQVPTTPTASPTVGLQRDSEDVWLKLAEAAEYLGVSKSTLYHYSCHEQIERRKVGGRLAYRRSALDKFKEAHTRPASSRSTPARIIASAHSSGK